MERHVVVMYVPEPTSEKMKGYIMDACTEALEYASSQKLSLAFSIKLSDALSMKTCLKAMLYSIFEHMQRKDTLGDVALYVSDISQLKDLVHIVSEYLLGCEGWDTDIILRGEYMCTSTGEQACVHVLVLACSCESTHIFACLDICVCRYKYFCLHLVEDFDLVETTQV